ncbi:nuclease-related domain-containing protein [Cellulomonas endophytica]|uniref:nuclease-related domain-containing protein n=1 Tax=Cellulomonas endophytica TaxID=2494735 RepID=UPI00196B1D0D|nr:nuclease-related domain-containing protein [Cellulomonas endophytica]
MQEFRTQSWRRYGKARTYVVDVATGVQIGYRDDVSGELVPTDPSTARILGRWWELVQNGAPSVIAPAVTAPATVSTAPSIAPPDPRGQPSHTAREVMPAAVRTDEDLSAHRAGQAARARAVEELAARRAEVGRLRTWWGRVTDARTDERAWRIGAAAEESIGAELDGLAGHGWRVLHSLPVGERDADIDHVLIGPAGVFTVNSKHHPGASVWVVPKQVRVNGHPVPYLRNSRHEAARAARLLSAAAHVPVGVTAVLVFRLGSGSLTLREEPGDVLVVRAAAAAEALRRLPVVLSEEQVDRLFAVARWRSTWQPR